MLHLLTEYLVHCKQVSIPSVGSFSLEEVPAQLNVVDKLIDPPSINVTYTKDISIEEGQWNYLEQTTGGDRAQVEQRLQGFGKELLSQIQSGSFRWWGIGTIAWTNNHIEFVQSPSLLTPVFADRIIREDSRHNVRVGENQVSSSFLLDEKKVVEKKQDLEWVLWLIAFLAALFIFYCLYTEGFSVHASGLRTSGASPSFPW